MKPLNKSSPLLRSQDGFTLIEVMIALFIMVLIGVTTSKAVVDAAKLKEVLKDETEFSSEFRTSIGFIERDLNQVFNPRWLLSPDLKPMDPFAAPTPPPIQTGNQPAPLKTLSAGEINQKLKGAAFQAFEYWGPVLEQSGIRPSRFKGSDDTLSFVVADHARIYQQKRESIYAKVKYSLIPQPPNPNLNQQQNDKLKGLRALVKVENTRAFELEEPSDTAAYVNRYVILNNIQKIQFYYYKLGEKDPVKSWDSEAQEQKGIFPEAVEVEVTLKAPNERTLDSKILFKLETPNDVLPKTY